MELKTFKCRASAGGMLMTNPKTKGEVLSKTTISYVETWLKEQIYGVKKSIDSKYLNKGIYFEDQAIDKSIEWLDLPFTLKNETEFEDDFFTGTPDLIIENRIIEIDIEKQKRDAISQILDIKNSWDCFTFPLFEQELTETNYFYQVQIYMHLTGKKFAQVVYVLLNTPETYNSPEIDYENIDKKYRIKTFDVAYDESVIEKLKQRVLDCRNYIKTLNF